MKKSLPSATIHKLLSVVVIGMTAMVGYLAGTITSSKPQIGSQAVQAATISNRTLQINFKYNTSTSDEI